MPRSTVVRSVAVAAWAILTVSACSTAIAAPSPYRAEFDDALRHATTDFERQVLADHSVTKAEYDEAVAMLVECAAARGVRIGIEDVPGAGNGYSVPAAGEGVYDSCSRPLWSIELLYTAQLQNPDNRPFEELVVECLVDKGLVPDRFTVEDWRREQAEGAGVSTRIDRPEVSSCSSAPNER